MKTQLLKLLILTFSPFILHSQQDLLLTQFWNNYSFINPATCAMDYKHHVVIHYRNQWDGVNGAPNSLLGNYNYELNRNHGIGINYMYETIGNDKVNIGVLNYNYRFHFSDSLKHFLSIGAGIGVGNRLIDNSKFIPPTVDLDPLLVKSGTTYPKLNFGLAYQYKQFLVGLSSTQITEAFLARSKSGYAFHPARHYYFVTSYDFQIAPNFSLKPQVLVRTDAIKISTDVNLLATLYKNYSLGVTYRTVDAIAFIAQVDIVGRFRVGYSYDITTNTLKGISKGSHEIVLGFQLK